MSLHPLWPCAAVALVCVVAYARIALRDRTRAAARRLALAILVLLIGVRPIVGHQDQAALASDVDVVLLVDRTTSMAAEDWNGTRRRVDGVAHDARVIARRYPGARFAMVTFTSDGRVEMPFSTDADALVALADAVNPELYLYSRGSSISAGVEATRGLIERSRRERPGRRTVLFYLGDGEQTSHEPPASFAALRPLLSGGAVLGYGTPAGGRMATGLGRGYVHDPRGSDALSRIDEGNLRRIADDLGVGYHHRTAADEPALPPANGGLTGLLGGGSAPGGVEVSWVLGLLVFGVGLRELWDRATAHRELRRHLAPPTDGSP